MSESDGKVKPWAVFDENPNKKFFDFNEVRN